MKRFWINSEKEIIMQPKPTAAEDKQWKKILNSKPTFRIKIRKTTTREELLDIVKKVTHRMDWQSSKARYWRLMYRNIQKEARKLAKELVAEEKLRSEAELKRTKERMRGTINKLVESLVATKLSTKIGHAIKPHNALYSALGYSIIKDFCKDNNILVTDLIFLYKLSYVKSFELDDLHLFDLPEHQREARHINLLKRRKYLESLQYAPPIWCVSVIGHKLISEYRTYHNYRVREIKVGIKHGAVYIKQRVRSKESTSNSK